MCVCDNCVLSDEVKCATVSAEHHFSGICVMENTHNIVIFALIFTKTYNFLFFFFLFHFIHTE